MRKSSSPWAEAEKHVTERWGALGREDLLRPSHGEERLTNDMTASGWYQRRGMGRRTQAETDTWPRPMGGPRRRKGPAWPRKTETERERKMAEDHGGRGWDGRGRLMHGTDTEGERRGRVWMGRLSPYRVFGGPTPLEAGSQGGGESPKCGFLFKVRLCSSTLSILK